MQQYVPEYRRTNYKNRGQFSVDALRRRHNEAQVEIRRQRRDANLAKRRHNVGTVDDGSSDEEGQIASQSDEQFHTDLPSLLEKLNSSNQEDWLDATVKFRRILSREKKPPIQEVIDCGVVPRFVQFLQSSEPSLAFEAAWALTNVASGNAKQTREVIDAGAIPLLVNLLSSPHANVQEQACWALGNIAGDSSTCRDLVLQAGAVPPMIALLDSKKIGIVRNVVWTFSNFCRGRDPHPDWEIIRTLLPALAQLLYHNDSEILVDACWSVSFLSDGSNDKIQAVLDCNIPRRLVELLMSPSEVLQTPALRCLGNIVTGDDQ